MKFHGKWSLERAPHTGWTCIRMEDVGTHVEICQMCESQPIRYVHIMRHQEFPTILRCGNICAGLMEQNKASANKRQANFATRNARRERWTSRNWRESKKGNLYLKTDGFRIILYNQTPAIGWKSFAVKTDDNSLVSCNKIFGNSDAAALAIFDLLWPTN